MTEELIAYAMDFISFLMQNMRGDKSNIKNIVLFGSVARGDATKKSDIDIFVNLFKSSEAMKKEIAKLTKEFYESGKYREYWKLLDVENEIKCEVGKLDAWCDLKQSIVANGIIIYGKFQEMLTGKNAVLLYWDRIKPETKRVQLSKTIYGYTYSGKKYHGILEETGGMKLGTNCVLVPLDAAERISKPFKKLDITPKIMHISYHK